MAFYLIYCAARLLMIYFSMRVGNLQLVVEDLLISWRQRSVQQPLWKMDSVALSLWKILSPSNPVLLKQCPPQYPGTFQPEHGNVLGILRAKPHRKREVHK